MEKFVVYFFADDFVTVKYRVPRGIPNVTSSVVNLVTCHGADSMFLYELESVSEICQIKYIYQKLL